MAISIQKYKQSNNVQRGCPDKAPSYFYIHSVILNIYKLFPELRIYTAFLKYNILPLLIKVRGGYLTRKMQSGFESDYNILEFQIIIRFFNYFRY